MDKAFTIAASADPATLQRLRDLVIVAIDQGWSYRRFRSAYEQAGR